jgi:hypothetical protein
LQPLPREVYADATLNRFDVVADLAALSADEWARYEETVVKPNAEQPRSLGRYATAVRKRRREAVAA